MREHPKKGMLHINFIHSDPFKLKYNHQLVSSIQSFCSSRNSYVRLFIRRRLKLSFLPLQCVLVPLTPGAIIRVIPSWYSWEQYNYFCWDPRALLDRATIASFGVFCVYLLVDLLGKSLAFRISLLFIVWPFVSPAIHACLRNLNLRKYAYVALMSGRITNIYIAKGNRSELRYPLKNSNISCLMYVTVEDEGGRKIQTRAWFRSIYSDIDLHMKAHLLIFSRSKQFHSVHFVSELYLPQLGIFFGDYPTIHRRHFLQLLNQQRENNESQSYVGKNGSQD
ncbi:hypothetical protein Gasu2_19780 [Galdieria sulphuraria]|uniref:Uncharacterized protein n=1 Tax=Galdieria sulphuraria TaxID=130081 RepID=M2Y5T4_GALSU|nr:hypothetical protein Gasu_14630 isoform 1 [Galdieria sulphuraria]EME31219.1 hypothetical protein isoform 1 [Galdieria sulphuraria]GJD07628.1 hypothetical protein Gasu2_19780 [Galdieria sulphuraria]|eukprot:XP_005707739.1 hypothetical protein isoform 1 [Galdieria sulphuraria]